MRDFDWQIIVTLHKTCSITKTAELLFISQPTLTKRIQIIENEMGVPLIVRGRRGSEFTAEGERIAWKAEAVVAAIQEIKNDVVARRKGVRGVLRLGVPYSYVRYVLPTLLAKYSARNPGVEVDIVTELSDELVHRVEDGTLDLTFARYRVNDSYLERVLVSEDLVCVVYNRPFELRELADLCKEIDNLIHQQDDLKKQIIRLPYRWRSDVLKGRDHIGDENAMKKAISLGMLASAFFAATFVLNRSMNLGGGYWLWSASLRYLFMLPMTWALADRGHRAGTVLTEIKAHPWPWLKWSTVGFGLFYMPLTWASVYGASWFVAATWQLTIVAGVLLTPLFGKRIPRKNLACSGVILAGVFLLQVAHFRTMHLEGTLSALALILIAAFSYPLGNRKMMVCCPAGFSTIQRVFGMTLCSMPFWLVMSAIALVRSGLPSGGQTVQAFVVALFSGVVATLLFFEATNLSRHDARQLAMVEATQSGEVLFTLLGGVLFLGDSLPDAAGFTGIALIVAGMAANSLAAAK